MKLSDMSIEELLKDKKEAEESLRFGQLMRDKGITTVDGSSLETLMSIDRKVLAIIDAELQRRNVQPVTGTEGQGE